MNNEQGTRDKQQETMDKEEPGNKRKKVDAEKIGVAYH